MKPIYFILLTVFFAGCVSRQISTIVGCNYDMKKNQTDYLVFPYGQVSIPGKWERTIYNHVSRQQFFINQDSIIIAISFGICNKYEFNQDNSKQGFDFIKAFYEWDSKYLADISGFQAEEIERDSTDNYIIWKLGSGNNTVDGTYFLFGEKNRHVKNFSIMTTNKWSIEQKITFLKQLYQIP
jgi:hypothetical protein